MPGEGEQWPDLVFGLSDGAGDDPEEFAEGALWGAEADPQDGDQDLLGEGERGRVPAGWFAGGWAAPGGVQGGVALGLVGHLQAADQLVPLGGGQAGQGWVRPARALGVAGGVPGRGRGPGWLGAQGVVPVAVPVVAAGGSRAQLCVADLDAGGVAAGAGFSVHP